MPRDRTLLDFDVATRRALRVIFKYLEHLTHPAHVHTLGKVRPFLRTWRTDEPAMLGGHAKSLDMPQVLLEERTIASRDNVHEVARVCRESRERSEGIFRWYCHRWCLNDR